MSSDEQLIEWVKGNSIHNQTRDECCPDFSCCTPELLRPKEEREHFLVADETERSRMLMQFLGQAIATYEPKAKVHITGPQRVEAADE